MELKEYVAPLRKWWWLIIIATVIAAAASFLVVSQQPNLYRARTTLMIGRAIDNPNPSGTEFWLTQQLAQTYAEIATRDPVQFGTMKALGLAKMPDYSVRVLEETQLIEFSVTDAIPERAQAVANQLAEQLILQSPTSPDQEDQSRKQFISSQLNGLEESISETEVEIANQQDELTKASSARQISEIRTKIDGLQSKLSSLQANYANLLANTAQGALNSLSIIENASLPQTPIGPNIITTVLVAATIGFTLALGAAYFLDYLDDTVSTAEEITKLTGMATLAGIAKIDVDKEAGTLITLSQPRSPTSEAYRGLRTGIQYSSVDNPDRATLMVTSPNPMEGKSVTVANLSTVMAQAGFRVLIIDADLRRPTQHELFGLSANNGLTNLLLNLDIEGPLI